MKEQWCQDDNILKIQYHLVIGTHDKSQIHFSFNITKLISDILIPFLVLPSVLFDK